MNIVKFEAFLVIPVLILVLAFYQTNSVYETDVSDDYKEALIIDQLAVDLPNEEFLLRASYALAEIGYSVDVRNDATISLYEALPSMGYDLIILRTHSVAYTDVEYSEDSNFLEDVYHLTVERQQAIFTTEPYKQSSYMLEQLNGQLTRVRATDDSKEYFAINHAFIQDRMKGNFQGATVIMMGCYGFISHEQGLSESTYVSLPQILINKGAKAVIGWSGAVGIDHTDNATLYLLDKMRDGMNLEEAINSTKEKFGVDHEYGGILQHLTKSSI